MQNRRILGIPVETPDSPITTRSYQSRGSGQTLNNTKLPTKNGLANLPAGARPGTQDPRERDSKKEFGLPEILTKSLSEFNDVFSSTVSEIRVCIILPGAVLPRLTYRSICSAVFQSSHHILEWPPPQLHFSTNLAVQLPRNAHHGNRVLASRLNAKYMTTQP